MSLYRIKVQQIITHTIEIIAATQADAVSQVLNGASEAKELSHEYSEPKVMTVRKLDGEGNE